MKFGPGTCIYTLFDLKLSPGYIVFEDFEFLHKLEFGLYLHSFEFEFEFQIPSTWFNFDIRA